MPEQHDPESQLEAALTALRVKRTAQDAGVKLDPSSAPLVVDAAVLEAMIAKAVAKATGVRAAPAAGTAHVRCEVCGHSGMPTAEGHCPNNNCPRHDDPEIVGLHPASGRPLKDREEYDTAVKVHAAAA